MLIVEKDNILIDVQKLEGGIQAPNLYFDVFIHINGKIKRTNFTAYLEKDSKGIYVLCNMQEVIQPLQIIRDLGYDAGVNNWDLIDKALLCINPIIGDTQPYEPKGFY